MDASTGTFGGRLRDILTGHALTMMINIGHRTGLLAALAHGPASSAELATRAGLSERHVREWLGALATGRIVEYEPASGRYTLPPEHAALLTGATARNVGPSAAMLGTLDAVLPQVAEGFATGAGVPYAAYAAAGAIGQSWRHVYDEHLIDGFVATVPGLTERLMSGARVLDLGCGTGHAIALLAAAFPASTFVGVDLAPEAIALAETERAQEGLPNASFAVGDAAELAAEPPFDVIFAFDAVHDQQVPAAVLRRIREALAPGGVFVMVDSKFSRNVEQNIGNPYAPMSYAISLLFCVPTSLAGGGAALGAMWGTELAVEMLAAAGFVEVTVLDSPRPQNCIYVCRPAR